MRKVARLLDTLVQRNSGSSEDESFKALVEMGAEAVEPLVTVISRELAEYEGKNDDRIRAAFAVLAKLGDAKAVGPLLGLLDLNLQRFHAMVAGALQACGEPAAREGLRGRLKAPDAQVRRNAVEVLGVFEGIDVVAALATALDDADATVRADAVRALERAAGGRPRGRGALMQVGGRIVWPPQQLETPPAASAAAQKRQTAEGEAKKIAVAARDAILRALDDRDRHVQRRAIDALANAGDTRIVERVRKIIKEGGPADDRLVTCVRALGVLGDRDSVPLLLPFLESERPELAQVTVEALGAMRAPQAVPGLIAALEREDHQAQEAAIRALGEIGDPRAFEPLRAYCLNKQYFGGQVVEAIARLPGDKPRAFLIDRVRMSKDEAEVRAALEKIEERGDEPGALCDDEAIPEAALAALERPLHSTVRTKALEMLARAQFRPAFDIAAKCLSSPDMDVRQEAASTLGALGDRRAVELLRAQLKKGDPQLKSSVTIALARLGDAETIAAAIKVQEADVARNPGAVERTNLGILYLYEKSYDKAQANFELQVKEEPDNYIAAYNLACTYSLTGRKELAIEWLRRATTPTMRSRGFSEWTHIEADSDLDSIRDTREYQEIIGRLKAATSGRKNPRAVVVNGNVIELTPGEIFLPSFDGEMPEDVEEGE